MFAMVGIGVALYTILAAATGRVWVKSGIGGRLVARDTSPEYFWICIAIYAGLSLALMFVF